MRDLIDGEALQSFMAVAEEFNFRRAAERLHVDQSALSRRIQKLEAQLGFDLFSRSTREVRLTEAGRVFYTENLRTLAHIKESIGNARRVAEGKTGLLRIGYMSFAAIDVMPRVVRAFRSLHPDISIQITYVRTQGQKLALARDEIDVGFMIGPLLHQDFATLKVSEEPLVAVLPMTHWLVTRTKVFLRDLAECEIILGDYVQWDSYRIVIDDLFSAKGLILRPALEASSTMGILGLVAANLGVSVYPEGLRRFQPRKVVMKDIEDCDRHIETVVAWRKNRSDVALSQFVQCCRSEFSDVLA